MAERIVATAKAPESKQKFSNFCKLKRDYNSSGFSADKVLQIQRTAGNRAAQRLIKSRTLQAKLRVSQPDDIYEQEADRMAEYVMRMPDPVLQREYPMCEDEKKVIQAKVSSGKLSVAQDQSLPSLVHEVLQSPGQPLDPTTRVFMESRFGHDFSRVRVHSGPVAEKSAKDINALAYTVGHNIMFGTDRFAPGTHEGRRLLAHELTHVVQQVGQPRILNESLEINRSHSSPAHKTIAENKLRIHNLTYPGQQFASTEPVIQRTPDDTKPEEKDAEKILGEKLLNKFPSGVTVAFYDVNTPEILRRAEEWAKQEEAIGPKGTKIKADQLVFGKAIPDTLSVASTLTALGNVLSSAVTSVQSSRAASNSGISPDKINTLAVFSHGTSNWCGIGGGITSSSAATIIKSIAPVVTPNLKVLLYSCSGALGPSEQEDWRKGTLEGGGVGSLAGKIRDALIEAGIAQGEVWGHTTVGHVSRNFALRFFTAVSGKGQEGFAYAGFYVWGVGARVMFLQQLQRLVEEKGYIIDDKTSKLFFAKASNETQKLMYNCYADANKNLSYNEKNLAEMAPKYPQEVAKIIQDHWDKNYWTAEKKDKLAEKLIKDVKLAKAME